MTIPSQFTLLHYEKEIVMIADCTMDLVTYLLISYMIFESNIQKLPMASHLKGLDSSFQFCCHVRTFICIQEGG